MYKKINFPKGVFPMESNPEQNNPTGIPFVALAQFVSLTPQDISVLQEKKLQEYFGLDSEIIKSSTYKWVIRIHPATLLALQKLMVRKHKTENIPFISHDRFDLLCHMRLIDTIQDNSVPLLLEGILMVTCLSVILFPEGAPKQDVFLRSTEQTIRRALQSDGTWNTEILQDLYLQMLVPLENIVGCTFTDMDPLYTHHDGDSLTPYETDLLLLSAGCPDCGNLLQAGPTGGMSMNMTCSCCEAKFNIMPGFMHDRISNRKTPIWGEQFEITT